MGWKTCRCGSDLVLVEQRFLFDGRLYLHPASLPGMAERTLTIGSVSSEYRMIGWRVWGTPREPPRLLRNRPFQPEHPQHTSLRNVRRVSQDLVERCLHSLRIHSPAGLHRDVLYAVDSVGRGHAGDPGIGPLLPEQLAGSGVERTEVPVVRSAQED